MYKIFISTTVYNMVDGFYVDLSKDIDAQVSIFLEDNPGLIETGRSAPSITTTASGEIILAITSEFKSM